MEQPVARGPLAARWALVSIESPRAGALGSAEVEIANEGAVTWRSRGDEGIQLAYHWLDERGNAIVWDGIRTPLARPVAPGETLRATIAIRAPIPPGGYRLAIDLVDEHRLWFAEVGNQPLELEQDVLPRIERALASRGGDPAALAAQEEPLVAEDEAAAVAFLAAGCAPAPDWSRRVLDAHQEGYAVVGGSIDVGGGRLSRRPSELAPWAPGAGRVPRFPHPLVCPSVVRGVEPVWSEPVAGLPAARAPAGEPAVYDGRIVVRARRV
jgi:hypothetical protein